MHGITCDKEPCRCRYRNIYSPIASKTPPKDEKGEPRACACGYLQTVLLIEVENKEIWACGPCVAREVAVQWKDIHDNFAVPMMRSLLVCVECGASLIPDQGVLRCENRCNERVL